MDNFWHQTIHRAIAVFATVLLACALLFGCAANTGADAPASQQDVAGGDTSTTGETSTVAEVSAPAESRIANEPVTLTYFAKMAEKPAEVVTNYNEMPYYQKMEENTGIHIEWIHAPVGPGGSEIDSLNMLVASNDIPDLVKLDWNLYPGGPVKALQEGLAIPLNDYMASCAPEFSALLSGDSDIARSSKNDDGTYYYFPILRPDPQVRVWYGPQIRGDWLNAVNLNAPKTIDDWYAVLTAFKQNDLNGNGDPNDEIPFTSPVLEAIRQFAGAWGLGGIEYYVDAGTVKYASIQPEFEEFLATMNKWYSEGLIDPDFAVTDGAGMLAKITSNTAGSFFGSLSGNMGRGNLELMEQNPDFELVGTTYPSLDGNGNGNGLQSNFLTKALAEGTAITSANQHVEESIQWLDYHYSEEGSLLMNVGVEGESWEYVDGVPTYTELVTNNSDGLAPTIAMSYYAMGGDQHEVMLCELYQFRQMSLSTPQQAAANELWSSASFDLIMPSVTPSEAETAILTNIITDIKTYNEEMITKFIMGIEPLSNYGAFTENLNSMGLQDALTVYQAACKRYYAR